MVERARATMLLAFFAGVNAAGALAAREIVINEIHYDPPDKTRSEEFVELYNAGSADEDLSGWFFSDGIFLVIPGGTTLRAEEYLVVAEDPAHFEETFGFPADLGPYSGRLSNDGEALRLRDALGDVIDEVDYGVAFPWPTASAGRGSSMELVHPTLDNDLGGSWRASGYSTDPPVPPTYYLPAQSPSWRYRKGTSNPPAGWRAVGFVEDGSWATGRTSIGYGDSDDNTTLVDMQGGYTTIYLRHTFYIDDPADVAAGWKLRVYADDGCVVWINGTEVARLYAPAGALDFDAVGVNHEASWEEVDLPAPSGILAAGTNIIAIHALNQASDSSDFSIDATILLPGTDSTTFAPPTPGAENSVLSTGAAPHVRQVQHAPLAPRSDDDVAVTARVTDPDGVTAVTLEYQIVRPGSYVPSVLPHPQSVLLGDPTRPHEANPQYEDAGSWRTIEMTDDGGGADAVARDGVYSTAVPAQAHRTLVRYRIRVEDSTARVATVPYADDPSRNFAWFVYDGVPPFTASVRTVQPSGPPYTYGNDVMTSVPVYHILTREEDWTHCVAYSGSLQIPKSNEAARDEFNWQCTFVYEGVVYDHVRYRLRQANDRYGGSGKRAFRFRFNKGHHLEARDRYGNPYPTRWRTLNVGKMFDNKDVGNFGLTESMNEILWNLVGAPAPFTHTFQMRVLKRAAEAPAGSDGQYFGDFYGIFLAFEDYDARFLEAHGLEDGNLYKLKDQQFDGNTVKRHQGRFAVTNDADFQNIRNNLRPERTDAWLDQHVRYERWYPYHTVCEAIRHYDFVPADSHLKNRAWFFQPAEGSPLGRLWTLPHDSDASWGPNWNSGIDYSKNAIFASPGKPRFKQEYRNVIREFRDLLWVEDVVETMIDDLAADIDEISEADRDRWRSAPAEAGAQDFGPIEAKVTDMKRFAFVSWSGSTGPTVPTGGRARYLDDLANAEGDAGSLPATPVVTYAGPPGFPLDELRFETSAFSDPQGAGTFAALEWRLGEVFDPAAPPREPLAGKPYEWTAIWESGEIPVFTAAIHVPPVVTEGRRYRVRCRMKDTNGRWSHWSLPVELSAGSPTAPFAVEDGLRVTEVMYHPFQGEDFEFIELRNVSAQTLDLTHVRLTEGVEFSFAASDVTSLRPGEFVVLVNNRDAFEFLYDTSDIRLAGEYEGRLANDGESIAVTLASGRTVTAFVYSDAWYPATDGLGSSLQILDEDAPPADPNTAADWFASPFLNGTPGRPFDGEPPSGGFRLPGDGNADRVLDISDGLWLLRALFVPGSATLPCGGAEIDAGGNRLLLDVNDDERVDLGDVLYTLNYLFEIGPPPHLGDRCVRVDGCADRCGA